MKTGHTQGEWVLLRGGIEVQSETNEHEIFAYVGEHPVAIASVLPHLESEHDMPVSNYSMSEEEGMANARLISASPDLLDAVKSMLVCIGDDPRFWAEEKSAVAALKKAGVTNFGKWI